MSINELINHISLLSGSIIIKNVIRFARTIINSYYHKQLNKYKNIIWEFNVLV